MNAHTGDLPPIAERRALLGFALELADACQATVAGIVAAGFSIQAKADASLVTTADTQAELAFRALVADRFPGHGVLGEEGGLSDPGATYRWVIDPIDGTAEFARHLPIYGTIIGLFVDDRPLLGIIDHPALGLRLHGCRGLGTWRGDARVRLAATDDVAGPGDPPRVGLPSRVGFLRRGDEGHLFDALTARFPNARTFHTCYAHALAAIGGLDGTVEWSVPIWDLAATQVLIEEAGGEYRSVRIVDTPGHGVLHSAVFGRPAVVAAIANLLDERIGGTGPAACAVPARDPA